MSKTSYRWERVLLSILSQGKAKDWDILALSPQQMSQITTKGLLLLGIVLLWWWNWKLLLATSVGIVLMFLVYTFKKQPWQQFYRKWRVFFSGYNRKLTLAVLSGAFGAFITYMTASIWAESENRWLATGSILQGLGTLVTLFLLGWHIRRDRNLAQETKFDQLLLDLTASDPVKRLIAIRQLNRLAQTNRFNRENYLQLLECFRLMLAQPQEPIIQEALLDSLECFGYSRSENPLIQIPLQLHHRVSVNTEQF